MRLNLLIAIGRCQRLKQFQEQLKIVFEDLILFGLVEMDIGGKNFIEGIVAFLTPKNLLIEIIA